MKPLEGGITLISKPKFKLDNWLSGNLQDTAMKYCEQAMNMHTFFTRVHNQIEYFVFNKIKVNDVEEGKNQMLFSEGNTKSFYGKDFVGKWWLPFY